MSDLNVALILRFIDQATGPARAAMRNIQGAAERVQQFGQAQIMAGRAMQDQAATNIRALGGQAIAVSAVAYAAYAAVGPAVQFEQAMARVGAVSNATAEDQARMSRVARELGASTSFSAMQAAEGMQYLAMAGFDVNQTVAAMPGVLNLAAAAGADLGSTANIASNIMSGFALDADQMGRIGDVLVNTFTSSNTTLESLGATMSYAAPVARSLGVSIEQTAAMAGLLGNTGIAGERAGTALRAMFTRLAAPAGEAAEVLRQLNVQVSDQGGNLRDIPTILAEMDRAMTGMGSSMRTELMNTIFGTEAAGAAAEIAAAAASGQLQEYTTRLHEAGSAARVAERMNDSAQGALRRLASAAQEVQIAFGNGLLPVLRDIVDQILPIVVAAGQWIEANQELVTQITYLGAALVGLKVALITAQFAFWTLYGTVGRLRVLLGLLAIAASSHPLVALATLIAAGAVAIYENWDGIAAYFQEKFDRIKVAFKVGFLGGIVQALQEVNPFGLIRDAALGLIEWMTGYDLAGAGSNWIMTLWSGLTASWNTVWTWLQSLLPRTVALLTKPAIGLFEAGAAMIQSLWDGAVERFNQFIAWVQSIPSMVVGAIGSIDLSANVNFGGAAGPPAEGEAPAPLPPASRLNLGTLMRAAGGPVMPGLLYRINEQGLEGFASGDYLQPLTAGHIVPAGQTQRLMSGSSRGAGAGQGDTIHITNNIHGADPSAVVTLIQGFFEARDREHRFALHDGGMTA